MNMVLSKKIYFSIILLCIMPLSFSSNVCNVNFGGHITNIVSSTGNYIGSYDDNGNIMFIGKRGGASGSLHEIYNTNSNIIFGSSGILFNDGALTEGSVVTSPKGLLIKSQSLNNILYFGSDGSISVKGKFLYDEKGRKEPILSGSDVHEANTCTGDGSFCASSDRTGLTGSTSTTPALIENAPSYAERRDYWCDVTGSLSGSCKYDVYSSTDCYFPPEYICVGNWKKLKHSKCDGGTCGFYYASETNCGSGYCDTGHWEDYSCNCITSGNVTTCDTCTMWVCDSYHHRGCTSAPTVHCYSYYT
jgi:hypothetical protein